MIAGQQLSQPSAAVMQIASLSSNYNNNNAANPTAAFNNQQQVRKVKPAKNLQAFQQNSHAQQQQLPYNNQQQQPQQQFQQQAAGGNRIEFYHDPEFDNDEDDQQQKSTSRLGQRSSRMQLQEELIGKQRNNADDEAKFIIPQKLYNQLKSPTDKLQKPNTFKAFQYKEHQQLPQERKSSESRKRKRASQQQLIGDGHKNSGNIGLVVTKNKSSSYSKGKPNNLKLVENDYFNVEDKQVSHLRNLTQKAVHHYPGGLGPWQWANNAQKGAAGGQSSSIQHGTGHQTTRNRAKSIGNPSSISTPDFSQLQNKLGQKYQQANQNSGGGPSQEGCLDAASSQEMLEQNKIQRKMAQTYLSGLSRGFISNMDNLKLINNCLHQDQSTNAGSQHLGQTSSMLIGSNRSPHNSGQVNKQPKHVANKSFENLRPPKHIRQQGQLELQNPTKSFQTNHRKSGKNGGSTLSTSPKRARDGSNSAGNNYSRKVSNHAYGSKKGDNNIQATGTGTIMLISNSKSSGKKGGASKSSSSGISDLHLFIKAFEKDFSNSQGPATPKQILRKVEDQMRACGLDPKSGNNQATAQALALKFAAQHSATSDSQFDSNNIASQQQNGSSQEQNKRRKKSLPPKLKLMGLSQPQQQEAGFNTAALFATSNQNVTPSNLSSNGSGSYPFTMARSQMNINHGSTKKHGNNVANHNQGDGSDWQQYTTRNRSSGSTGRNGRKRSNGAQRDRSGDSRNSRHKTKSGQLSTGRGASSGSGGRQPQQALQLTHAPMVMTERSNGVISRKPAKSSQERTSYHMKNKSFSKGGGSALAKTSKTALHQIAVKQQLAAQQQHKTGKPAKLNKSQHKKGASLSAMNHQIATGRQTDQQLLQQLILQGTGGSISVRNSDYNSGKNFATKQGTSGSKSKHNNQAGSQTNRQFNGQPGTTSNSMSNDILFEMIQNQAGHGQHQPLPPTSKKSQSKQNQPGNLTLRQSGSQSSRTPASLGAPLGFNKSGQPIKMIKKTNHE